VTADIKPYPAYKDSGLPWLGRVPDHWTLLHGRACFREKKVVNAGMRQTTVLSLSYGQIVIKPVEKLHGLVPASFETYQVIDEGDIVVRPTDLQNDWNSLRFGLSSHRGIITSAYMCLSTLDALTRDYGFLLLHAYDLKKVFYGLGSGLRQNLDWGDFKYLPCVVPPVSEQAAIVRYLDHADRKVRHAIRARQQLIKLLTEQKQAIIQRAVTRGLDPNVRFKLSGVDWLSGIPEHWQELPLKRMANIDNSGCYGDEPEEGCCVLPVATTAQIDEDGHFAVGKMPLRSFSASDATRYGCAPGDILVVKSSGSVINVISGKAGIVNSESPHFVFSNFLMRVVPKIAAIDPQFLFLVLNSPLTHERVKRMVAGTTYPNLRVGEYISSLLPVPPLSEQREIVAALQEATVSLDKAIDAAHREISLLHEYRTRLIADVVTGKLDVRDVPVPDDETDVLPEELEGIDDTDTVDQSDDATEESA